MKYLIQYKLSVYRSFAIPTDDHEARNRFKKWRWSIGHERDSFRSVTDNQRNTLNALFNKNKKVHDLFNELFKSPRK